MSTPITDLVTVVRSKNSGPYVVTFDIIFKNRAAFDLASSSPEWEKHSIAKRLGVPLSAVRSVTFFPVGLAIKVAIRRPITAGDPGDCDVYGCQQHCPFLEIEIG